MSLKSCQISPSLYKLSTSNVQVLRFSLRVSVIWTSLIIIPYSNNSYNDNYIFCRPSFTLRFSGPWSLVLPWDSRMDSFWEWWTMMEQISDLTSMSFSWHQRYSIYILDISCHLLTLLLNLESLILLARWCPFCADLRYEGTLLVYRLKDLEWHGYTKSRCQGILVIQSMIACWSFWFFGCVAIYTQSDFLSLSPGCLSGCQIRYTAAGWELNSVLKSHLELPALYSMSR